MNAVWRSSNLTGGQSVTFEMIEGCDSEIRLFDLCGKFAASRGYNFYGIFKSVEEYHHDLYDIIIGSNWPVSLVSMYDSAALLKGSPFAESEKMTDRPFLWTTKEMYNSRDEATASTGKELFEAANMSHGAGFPVANGDGITGTVIFISDHDLKNEDDFDHLQQFATHAFSKTLLLHEDRAKPQSTLSKREHECLLWTSEGKTSYEIGMILGLSENTINNYLVTVGRKLGAVNRPHMVGIALRKGFI